MSDSLEEAFIRLQVEVAKAKARARVRDECLKIAMEALADYANVSIDAPGYTALDRIEEMLAEIIHSQ